MISEQQFKTSIAKHFAGQQPHFPKRRQDQLIFLGAATLYLAQQAIEHEKALNSKLIDWLKETGVEKAIDHVTLRRYLVDFGFLQRDRAGHHYRVCEAELTHLFDDSVLELNLYAIIAQAQAQREAKRQQWLKTQRQDKAFHVNA